MASKQEDQPWVIRADGIGLPLVGRFGSQHPNFEGTMALHDEAIQKGNPSYCDPASRLVVFTAHFLADRGYCCVSGCRHCPYIEGSGDLQSSQLPKVQKQGKFDGRSPDK